MSCCGGDPEQTNQEAIARILSNLPVAVHGHYDTGGHQLQGLSLILPPPDGVQRKYGRPVFHSDGSIEYPKGDTDPPTGINGFYRDEHNPWLFRPLWGECLSRMQGARFDPKTGEIDVKMVCNNKEAKHFQKFVKADECAECPVRRLRKNPAQQS